MTFQRLFLGRQPLAGHPGRNSFGLRRLLP